MSQTDKPSKHDYRLYRINRAGQIDGVARIIEAMGDDDAIGQARVLAGSDRVELWSGARLVAGIAARAAPQAIV